jgi:hypothetical protein
VRRTVSDDVHVDFEELLFSAWAVQSAELRADPKLDELQSVTHLQKTSTKEGDAR